jgi:hypothetical protein
MQAIHLKQPGGLDNLVLESAAAAAPGPGEITIRNKASSLNFHDYAVVIGLIAVEQDRIPMSDGAGIVEAVGPGVTEFAVGDKVMSCFFPHWQSGRADAFEKIIDVPGDMADGFAAELVTKPVTAFTRIPEGYSFEAAATLPCAALTAWRALMVEARVKPGDSVLVPRLPAVMSSPPPPAMPSYSAWRSSVQTRPSTIKRLRHGVTRYWRLAADAALMWWSRWAVLAPYRSPFARYAWGAIFR